MLIRGESMNLREYLFLKRMSVTEFSELVDHSRNYISQIVNGKYKPSKRLARAIEKMTNGEVTAQELMQDIPKKEKPKKNTESKPTIETSPKEFLMEGSIFGDKGE